MKIKPELIESYQNTLYTSVIGITIQVGRPNADLDSILEEGHLGSAVYITAWNPFSEMKSSIDNTIANNSLKEDLLKYVDDKHIIKGIGKDAKEEWPGEESYLVLGISMNEGLLLAKKYCQNAFIYHSVSQASELIIARSV